MADWFQIAISCSVHGLALHNFNYAFIYFNQTWAIIYLTYPQQVKEFTN